MKLLMEDRSSVFPLNLNFLVKANKNKKNLKNINTAKHLFGILTFLIFTSVNCFCQQDSVESKNRILPLGKEWFEERNIDLPLPYGISAFFTHMSRKVEISNVEVAFLDQPMQSINDFAYFELQNKSTVTAIKLDAWLLPFMNFYGLLGYVSTDASLDAVITIERPLFPGQSFVIPINSKSIINGTYIGTGSSLVGGYANWFVLGDVNYGYSKLDEFDGTIDFWMFSMRTGLQSKIKNNNLRSWIGVMYLSSKRTLNLSVENDLLGQIKVDVHQKTANPLTLQLGTSLGLAKHFEILAEIGSNFSDASLGVLSATYRFNL